MYGLSDVLCIPTTFKKLSHGRGNWYLLIDDRAGVCVDFPNVLAHERVLLDARSVITG